MNKVNSQIANIWKKAKELGLKEIPLDIQNHFGPLEWTERNKEFLEIYCYLGVAHFEKGNIEEALWIFSHCSEICPQRFWPAYRAIDCYFYFNRPVAIIDICNRYSEYSDGYFYYSKLLAFFQLEDYSRAWGTARKAIPDFPEFAKLIAQKRHKRKYEFGDFYGIGSIKEAYSYWNHQGDYWLETKHGMRKIRQYFNEYKENSHKLLEMKSK